MRLALLVVSLSLAACPAPEGGRSDAGEVDGGAPDAGATPVTAGPFSGRYTDANGRQGRYTGWVPEGLVSPGALVFLHADDGREVYAEWINPTTRGLGTAHGMIVISLQEPDGDCWWAPNGEDDAHFIGELVAEILIADRQVDPSRVVLVGKSGGGFLASGVPALLGFPWGGAVVGLCGGDLPRRNGGNCDTDEDAPVANVRLFSATAPVVRYWFATTTGDEYRAYSVVAADAFDREGADVTLRTLGAGGHCEFDLLAELTTALNRLDP